MKGDNKANNVVAIGASAGGLEALQEFLSHLPVLPETSIIVAQHLSPSHKSKLVELLSRETNLKVIEAQSGVILESNMVYITPPDSAISIRSGKIHLEKPASPIGPKPSVDVLFSSLSNEIDLLVIGVILSGTGSDGAYGVKALKNAGAYIITQEPDTAKYNGMPLASIQTGAVDAVLAPDRMGEEILAFLSDPLIVKTTEFSKIDDRQMDAIFRLLGDRTGTDFSEYKLTTIGRRLHKRMVTLHIQRVEDYLQLLESNPKEIDEMFNTILIGVTSFFRDKDAFEAIKNTLRVILQTKEIQEPIRIWSAGCSSGEEAYSIAILLHQILGDKMKEHTIQIFATDIDDRAITKARRGVYDKSSLESLDPDIISKYFTLKGEAYELNKQVRKLVLFSKHDLIRNPPYLKLDLIVCRNLLIYFNASLQQKVLPIFHYALQPKGVLFLGKSETVGGFGDLFSIVDSKNKIFKRKRGGQIHSLHFTAYHNKKQERLGSISTGGNKELTIADMVKETLFKTYEHPYVVVNEALNIREVNGDVRLFMSLTPGAIQVNLIKMLNPELQMDVRTILNKAIKDRVSVKSTIKSFVLYGQQRYVMINAKPLLYSDSAEELFVVVFELLDIGKFVSGKVAEGTGSDVDKRIQELEAELANTKEQLQTYIEEIETSNEELVSLNEEMQTTNEELQSTNEELETTNEELESTSEEVQIAYNELRLSHEELERKEVLLLRYQADTLALLNNDLQAFVLVDPTFRILQFNHKAEETFSVLSGKKIKAGESIINLFPFSQVESFLQHFKIANEQGLFKEDKKIETFDGQERWYSLNYSAVKFDGTNVSSISMSLLDTTDLKIALSELNASERLVNSVFNAVTVGMCITDEHGIFVNVNDSYCKIYEFSRDELIGQPFSIVWPFEDKSKIEKLHQDFLAGESEISSEFEVETRSGKTIVIEVSSKRLILEDGRRYKVTSVNDITGSRASQLQLSTVTNNLPGVILRYKLRPDGTDQLLYLSEGAKLIWGMDSSECMDDNDRVWSLCHPEDMPGVQQSIEESARTMSEWSAEWRIIHPDGSMKWQRGTGNPSRVKDGSIVWDSLILDITDEKKAQEEAERFAVELRKILDSSLDVICTIDGDGKFVKVSQAAEVNWGYLPEELVGKPYAEFVHPDDVEKTEKAAIEIMAGVPMTNFENTYRRKDGSYAPVTWSAKWDKTDQVMYCVARDGTEKKLAVEQLKQSEKRFKALVENGADAIAILEASGGTSYVSPSVERILGYSEEEALALNLFEIIHPDDVPQVVAKMEEVVNSPGVPIKAHLARAMHKDGTWRWLDATLTNMLHDPTINGIIDNFRDNTAQVEADQELKASEQKYRDLFDSSPLPKLIYDLEDLSFLDVNQAALKVYGYDRDNFFKLKIFDLGYSKADVAAMSDTDSLSKSEGIINLGVMKHKRKNGALMRVEVSGHLLEVDDRIGLMVVCNDVTERELALRDLQDSEARYRGFYESQTNYIMRTDMDGNYTYFNKKFIEDFGWLYEDGEILGNNCLSSICERDHQKTIETVEKCTSTPGKVIKIEIDKPAQDGGYVSTLWDFVCIADEKGRPREIQCIGIDISDRIKFERQLIQSNERYRLVNLATNDAIYDWDVVADLFEWGEGFYRNFGYQKTDQPFKLADWADRMHPLDGQKNAGQWNDFLGDKEKTNWNKEFRWKRADGTYAFVEEIGYIIRDEKGRPKRMIGVLRDKSKAKQEELQKLLERQLSNVFKREETLTLILNDVLEHLVDFANYKVAEIWLISYDKEHINLVSKYEKGSVAKTFYKNENKTVKLKKGMGTPGLVWESGEVIMLDQISKNKSFIRKKSLKNTDLETAIGIPLSYNNEIVGVLVICTDRNAIQEENQASILWKLAPFLGAEIRRKLQEEELHLFFESAPDILAIAAPGGHFLKVNPAFCKLLGFSKEELTSQPFENLIHPDDLGETRAEFEETISGMRLAKNFVNRYRTASGEYRWISWSSSSIYGEDGLAFAYGRDVTQMKELQLLYDKASKLSRVGSWELDFYNAENLNVYWSPMTRQIFEVDEEYDPSLTGGIEFYDPESRVRLEDATKQLKDQEIKADLELLIHTAQGNPRWIRCIIESERKNENCIRLYGSIQDIHNLKVAELELLKFAKIIEHSKDGIAIADHKGVTMYLNPIFSEMLGFSSSEIHDRGGPESLYADSKIAQEVFENLLAGKYWKGDVVLVNSKGEKINYFLSGGPIFNESGELMAIYGIHTDITDRKRAELEIKEAFEEKNTILESIGDGFFTVDREWIVTYWNHRAEEILKVNRKDIVGKSLWDVFNNPAAQEFFEYYNNAMESGETTIFEKYYQELDIWVEISIFPSEKGLSVYFKDITIRRETEEAIRVSNERFERVTEATNDAIWDWDIVRRELYWGGGFKTLFGYTVEKETPSLDSWVSHIHDDDEPVVMQSIHNALNDPTIINWEMEYRYKKADGKYADVMDRGIIIRDESGQAIRMLGAMTDITYRKEHQISLERLNKELAKHAKELEISNAELEQFAYVASHDLQEPLRMVSSFLTQLEKKYKDQLDDKANQYIHFAVDGAKRMRQIILDLLQYSRVGRFEDEAEPLDLNQILADYRILRHQIIEEKSAEIKISEDLPVIYNFKTPITQIFHNLIDNALKYTNEDIPPQINIRYLDCNDHWEFVVQDNGIGIEKDYHDKIFVIFQRLHDKEKYSGTGMGLAIVKKILENLGGDIWLSSKVDKGSSFHFTLPKAGYNLQTHE